MVAVVEGSRAMSWHLMDGVALPDQVAGHAALEFCNTRAGWGSPEPREYLVSGRALLFWAHDVGLRPIPEDGPGRPGRPAGPGKLRDDSEPVRRALAFREALYRCALRCDDPSAWQLVGDCAAQARRRAVLRPAGPDRAASWQLEPDPASPGTDQVLDAVALAAEALLTSPLALTVAACPGAGCGWLFLDPRRRRRWCTMAVCGNRAKARRHAERLRA
jgi:hypothetical protein